MRLAKLLGAGKSFFGGQAPASYRKDKHVYLPKFNADRNPFTPKSKEAAEAVEPETAPAPEAPVAPVTPVVARAVVKPQTISTPPAPKPVAAKPARKAGWADKLNPFRAPQPEAPVVSAVQAELSLDCVKVLHNDLSDADVEVVPVKSRSAAPVAAPVAEPMDFANEPVLRTI
ncbi:MAG: hypothetical protein JF609_00485 [Verrucomicrobia bacterium]|nr:hypothetical protein [Verrucomicrobiota bacterium]